MSTRKKVLVASISFLVLVAMIVAGVVCGNKEAVCTPEEARR